MVNKDRRCQPAGARRAIAAGVTPRIRRMQRAMWVCEAEGLRVGDLGAMISAVAPAIGGMVKHDAETIQAERYAAPQSSLETCARAMDLLARHASEAGLDAAIPAFFAACFARGRAAGLGDESPAALVKVLRGAAR
jgi:3-hydroxyisobutyrate dehydrogenase-like beta-hydroxyacid dehydrogenase